MITGWITPEGKLVLAGGGPTEQYALKCWHDAYARPTAKPEPVSLEIHQPQTQGPDPV